QFGEPFSTPRGEHDLRPAAGEHQRAGFTDTRTRPGNDDHAVLENAHDTLPKGLSARLAGVRRGARGGRWLDRAQTGPGSAATIRRAISGMSTVARQPSSFSALAGIAPFQPMSAGRPIVESIVTWSRQSSPTLAN